jgi:hypothetical protein
MLGPWDTSMKNGLQTASWIHGCMVNASMNAFHYWWILLFCKVGSSGFTGMRIARKYHIVNVKVIGLHCSNITGFNLRIFLKPVVLTTELNGPNADFVNSFQR